MLQALLQKARLLGNVNSEMSPPITTPMEPSVPNYGNLTPPIDTSGYDNANAQIMALLANTPQMTPQPKAVQPAFRTQDALIGGGGALLSLLLGGGKAAEAFTGNYLGGKMGKAQQDTQTLLQNWQQQNQQNQVNYQGKVSAAKYGADVEGDKLNRQYRERDREDAQSGKMDEARLKSQLKIQEEAAKSQHRTSVEEKKALLRRLPPEARKILAEQQGYSQAFADAMSELTVEEHEKKVKTGLAQNKDKRDAEIHVKKMKELDEKIGRFSFLNKKDDAQIKKWESDTLNQTANRGQRIAEFEWRKKNATGISVADKKVFDLQTRKAGLIAESQTWDAQAPNAFGAPLVTENHKLAKEKIQREIANIDAQINRLRSIGGTDTISQKRQAAIEALRNVQSEADKNFIRREFLKDTGVPLGG
jgi:hypothetical protein